jgi:hypothetical protein
LIQIAVAAANTITRLPTIPAIKGIGTWVLWLEDEAAPLSGTAVAAEEGGEKVVPDVDDVAMVDGGGGGGSGMVDDGGGGGSATVDGDGGGDGGAIEVVVDTSSRSRTV